MAIQHRYDGQTLVGSPRVRFSSFGVESADGTASGYVFVAPDGTERYLWLQDDGAFYVGTRAQFEAQAGGTPVGGTGTISRVAFTSPDGTVRFLWMQDDGRLYFGTEAQFEAQSGGFSLW